MALRYRVLAATSLSLSVPIRKVGLLRGPTVQVMPEHTSRCKEVERGLFVSPALLFPRLLL